MIPLGSFGADTGAKGIAWPKCHVVLLFDCLDLRNAMVQLIKLMPMVSHDQGSHDIAYFNHLRNQGAVDDAWANDVTWPKKSYCTSFQLSQPKNTMVPFMMLLTSHDTIGSSNGISWPKMSCCTSFHSHNLRNVVVSLTMPLALCDGHASAYSVTWTKMSCCTSFWSPWPKECNDLTDYVISITWCWCQHQIASNVQGSHVKPHFGCLDLWNEWYHCQCHLALGDTCANDIAWPKNYIVPHFNCPALGMQ